MSATNTLKKHTADSETILETASRLASGFAANAAKADEDDRFVADNYKALKAAGLVEAAVPVELGGRGAEIAELCDMIRIIAQGCGSTGLAFSMHTHQVAIPAWRWRHQKVAAVEPLLKRIAAEKIILLSSGGSDWIGGSGKAEKVEGGYRITARKNGSEFACDVDDGLSGIGSDGLGCAHQTLLWIIIP